MREIFVAGARSQQCAMWRLAHNNMECPALVAVVAENVPHKDVDQFATLYLERRGQT